LRYVIIVNYINISVDIISSTEATFLSMVMALYLNLFMIATLPIISAFSKPNPDKPLTSLSANDNFIGLENHLLTWGNVIILISGVVSGFQFIVNQPDYITNPSPYFPLGGGYNPECQLVTSMFLMMGLPLATTAILVYKSSPWKNPIYRNYVLSIVIGVNILIVLVFFGGNNVIAGLFGTVKLPLIYCLYLFLISVGSQVLAFIYSIVVIRWLHPEF